MPPKRKCNASAGGASKKRKTISIEAKMDMINRSESGEATSDIARALNYSRSTVATIIKDKKRIKGRMNSLADVRQTQRYGLQLPVITKQPRDLITEMERLLILWLKDQNVCNRPISRTLLREKAQSIFSDLNAARVASGGDCNEEFVGGNRWFSSFKVKANLHNITLLEEAASADVSAACGFPAMFKTIVEKGDYLPEQIFNVNKTGLYWKKMPERTYLSKEEKSAPGYKASKDRLTILLGGNMSGDFKLKPLLVYHSLNPKALHRVIKESLPVIWKANAGAWVTIFQDWFLNYFVPAVERYCSCEEIPFKILLVLDNAHGHPGTLDYLHPNVKVVFLPPSTTSLLQPMNQGVIASFEAYYLRRTFSQAARATQDDVMSLREFWRNYNIYDAIKNIAASWDEVKQSTMKEVWNKLCPELTHDSQEFIADDITEARQAVVDIGNQLHLDISENDVVQLLNSHEEELTEEDLTELEQQIASEKENWDRLPPEPKRFLTKELAEAFHLIETGMTKLEEQDPNTERFIKVYHTVTECLSCYRAIYDEKKKNGV